MSYGVITYMYLHTHNINPQVTDDLDWMTVNTVPATVECSIRQESECVGFLNFSIFMLCLTVRLKIEGLADDLK